MADRFPSLEDFSAGRSIFSRNDANVLQHLNRTETRGNGAHATDNNILDDDFLTRERAALGDDAAQFASSGDNPHGAATVEDGDDDLLGGGDIYGGGNAGEEQVDEFESSFPALDTNNSHMAPGGTITDSGEPFLPGHPQPSYSGYAAPEEEPEVVKHWREQRDQAIQRRDETSANRKAETTKAAQSAIDDFYENYNTKKDKTIAQTRKEAEEFLASREDTSAGGTSWERIAKLVDLSGKGTRGGASGTGKERFRELLLSLKKDEHAPGATGY